MIDYKVDFERLEWNEPMAGVRHKFVAQEGAKLRLGEEVVAGFYGRESAGKAKQRWSSEKSRGELPDDIPDAIEVDLGHFKGWAAVTAERVKGRWLHYRLPDGQMGKVQVIGRDMLWRVPAAT